MGISFGNYLSGAANALTNAAGGNQAGLVQGNQINQSNLLDALQLARQQAMDQLNRQKAESDIALQGAQKNEAEARTTATLNPPVRPKETVTVGPNQQAVDPATGKVIFSGPTKVDPAVAAANRTAETIAAQGVQQDKNAAAREFTDALTNYQQTRTKNPALTAPLATKLTGWLTGAPQTFQQNENEAEARVKAAWQTYKNAGGNPADIPELGLISNPSGTTPTGTKPTAKDIVHAAINGQPLPPD